MNLKLGLIPSIYLLSIGFAEEPIKLPVKANGWYTFLHDVLLNQFA